MSESVLTYKDQKVCAVQEGPGDALETVGATIRTHGRCSTSVVVCRWLAEKCEHEGEAELSRFFFFSLHSFPSAQPSTTLIVEVF